MTESAVRGRNLMQEKNCYACHQIFGMGGFMGSDLTNAYSARGKDFLFAKIKWGDRKMPDFKLEDKEVYDIIEFLKAADLCGVSPARGLPVPWYDYPRRFKD